MNKVAVLALVFTILANDTNAGRKEADACAAGLPHFSQKIYQRVMANISPANKGAIQAVVKSTVKDMKSNNELPRGGTEQHVKTATKCIGLLGS